MNAGGGPPPVPPPLQGVPQNVLENYVQLRIAAAMRAAGPHLATQLGASEAQVQAALAEVLMALPHPAPSLQPTAQHYQLVFRHDCVALGCLDPQCTLCQHNPQRRCTMNFDRKYLVNDVLKAKCAAPIRVELVDQATGQLVDADLPAMRLEVSVLDGHLYESKFLETNRVLEGGPEQDEELDACCLLLNKKKNTPLLVSGSVGSNDTAGRIVLQLQAGTALLPDLSITDSSEAILLGRKPPFRLLVRAVWGAVQGGGSAIAPQASGGSAGSREVVPGAPQCPPPPGVVVRPAVSEGFVVATRRTRTAGKVDIPSVDDPISKLEHMGKETVKKLADIRTAAVQAGIELPLFPENCVTKVGEFKQLAMRVEQDGHLRQRLQNVLKLSKEKWDEAREHALRAVVADSRPRAWYADPHTCNLGLLFGCRLGCVDLERPLALLQPRAVAGPPAPSMPRHIITPMAQLSPAQRDLARQLLPQAAMNWWQPGHPGWAMFTPPDLSMVEPAVALLLGGGMGMVAAAAAATGGAQRQAGQGGEGAQQRPSSPSPSARTASNMHLQGRVRSGASSSALMTPGGGPPMPGMMPAAGQLDAKPPAMYGMPHNGLLQGVLGLPALCSPSLSTATPHGGPSSNPYSEMGMGPRLSSGAVSGQAGGGAPQQLDVKRHSTNVQPAAADSAFYGGQASQQQHLQHKRSATEMAAPTAVQPAGDANCDGPRTRPSTRSPAPHSTAPGAMLRQLSGGRDIPVPPAGPGEVLGTPTLPWQTGGGGGGPGSGGATTPRAHSGTLPHLSRSPRQDQPNPFASLAAAHIAAGDVTPNAGMSPQHGMASSHPVPPHFDLGILPSLTFPTRLGPPGSMPDPGALHSPLHMQHFQGASNPQQALALQQQQQQQLARLQQLQQQGVVSGGDPTGAMPSFGVNSLLGSVDLDGLLNTLTGGGNHLAGPGAAPHGGMTDAMETSLTGMGQGMLNSLQIPPQWIAQFPTSLGGAPGLASSPHWSTMGGAGGGGGGLQGHGGQQQPQRGSPRMHGAGQPPAGTTDVPGAGMMSTVASGLDDMTSIEAALPGLDGEMSAALMNAAQRASRMRVVGQPPQ